MFSLGSYDSSSSMPTTDMSLAGGMSAASTDGSLHRQHTGASSQQQPPVPYKPPSLDEAVLISPIKQVMWQYMYIHHKTVMKSMLYIPGFASSINNYCLNILITEHIKMMELWPDVSPWNNDKHHTYWFGKKSVALGLKSLNFILPLQSTDDQRAITPRGIDSDYSFVIGPGADRKTSSQYADVMTEHETTHMPQSNRPNHMPPSNFQRPSHGQGNFLIFLSCTWNIWLELQFILNQKSLYQR